MDRINRNNYEAFFIDYLDGNLSGSLLDELEVFLEKNEDLKEELEMMKGEMYLPNVSVHYKGKYKIKNPDTEIDQPVDESNIISKIIALHEDDLSEQQKKEVQNFIFHNPYYNKEYQYFKNVYLKPQTIQNESIKQKLYKNTYKQLNKSGIIYIISSSAAAIAVLLIIWNFLKNDVSGLQQVSMHQNFKTTENTTTENNTNNSKEDKIVPIRKQKENKALPVFIKHNASKKEIASHETELRKEDFEINKISLLTSDVKDSNVKGYRLKSVTSMNNLPNSIQKSGSTDKTISIKRNGKAIGKFYDLNEDSKLNHWDVVTLATKTINKISGEQLINLKFNSEGKLSEFALNNDVVKISKYSKN